MSHEVIFLSDADVRSMLTMPAVMEAVEADFQRQAKPDSMIVGVPLAYETDDRKLGFRWRLKTAVIRDLPNTLWGYDPDARVLFVSDAYPYTHEHEVGQCGMTAEEMPKAVRPEDTDVVIERALSWTRYVDAEVVIAELEAFLASHPADIIAPAHGGVITNPKALTAVFEAGLRRVRRPRD